MAKVDDLLERRAKQVVLAIVARLAHRSPRQRISPSKESRTAHIGNPKPQEARMQTRLSCKIDYLPTSNHRHKSTASEFFTGDSLQVRFGFESRPARFVRACRQVPGEEIPAGGS